MKITILVSEFEFTPKNNWQSELKANLLVNFPAASIEIIEENHTGNGVYFSDIDSETENDFPNQDLAIQIVKSFDFYN